MTQSTVTVSEHPVQPFYPNRVINFLGRFRKPIVSTTEQLMEMAVAATGLADFGAKDFLPALEIFCQALSKDRQLTYMGQLAARRVNVKLLTDRLQIRDTIKKDRDILQQPVTAPILICGNARSGTTLLHRLLSQDSQFRVVLAWEAYFAKKTVDLDPDSAR